LLQYLTKQTNQLARFRAENRADLSGREKHRPKRSVNTSRDQKLAALSAMIGPLGAMNPTTSVHIPKGVFGLFGRMFATIEIHRKNTELRI